MSDVLGPGTGGVVPTLGIIGPGEARGVVITSIRRAGSGPGARRYGLCALHTPHLHPHPHSPHSVTNNKTNNNTLSRDNKTARIRYACSPCNSMTSAAFSGALRSHAASMPSCPSVLAACAVHALPASCAPQPALHTRPATHSVPHLARTSRAYARCRAARAKL